MGSRNVLLDAKLTDSSGNPLQGKTVKFYYKPSNTNVLNYIGSSTTDSTGRALITVTVQTPGTYDFEAIFEGDDQYDIASAEVTNYTVKDLAKITLNVYPQSQ